MSVQISNRYGLPFVSEHNILVSTINGTGAGIEIIYVLIFIIYAGNTEKIRILELFTFVLSVFGVVVFGSLFALNGHDRKLFCGLAATIFSIIMYGSHLSIMVKPQFPPSLPPNFLNRLDYIKQAANDDGNWEFGNLGIAEKRD